MRPQPRPVLDALTGFVVVVLAAVVAAQAVAAVLGWIGVTP